MCNNNTYILKLHGYTFLMVCNQNGVQTTGLKGLLPRRWAGLFSFGGQCVSACCRAREGARAASGLDMDALGFFWGNPKQEHHLELNLKLCVFFLIIRIIRIHYS